MGPFLFAALLSTLHLEGDVTRAGGDFAVIPFDVPAGTVEVQLDHAKGTADSVLDWGLWSADGWRGWGGGSDLPHVTGVSEASPGFRIGPIAPGRWELVIGKARLPTEPVRWTADLTFRDAGTLPAEPRAPHQATVLKSGARWYAGDFHVHSRSSTDANATLDDIVALARSRGLDFVVLSDHNTVSQHPLVAAKQAEVPDLLLVRGDEVTTYAGHGNAVGLSQYVDHRVGLDGRTAADVIGDVVAQDAVFIVNHPVLDLGTACIGCAWKHADTPWSQVTAMEIQTGSYRTGIALFTTAALAMWDAQLDAGAHIACVGGSDDHRAGNDTGAAAGRIGTPTTLVWADELSEAALLAGLRAGRTVTMLRGPDDPMITLTAVSPEPGRRIGDTVTGARVTIEAHVTRGSGTVLAMIRNGSEAERIPVDSDDWTHRFTYTPRAGGDRIRAHVTDGVDPIVVTSHLWLVPGPGGGGCGLSASTPPEGLAALAVCIAAFFGVGLVVRARRRRKNMNCQTL